jgi:hypothetical protein
MNLKGIVLTVLMIFVGACAFSQTKAVTDSLLMDLPKMDFHQIPALRKSIGDDQKDSISISRKSLLVLDSVSNVSPESSTCKFTFFSSMVLI